QVHKCRFKRCAAGAAFRTDHFAIVARVRYFSIWLTQRASTLAPDVQAASFWGVHGIASSSARRGRQPSLTRALVESCATRAPHADGTPVLRSSLRPPPNGR